MDSSALTCNDWYCWGIGMKVGIVFTIVVFALLMISVLWVGIWRPLLCGHTSRSRERDIESGRLKKRGPIAAFFLGADPPPRNHRRLLPKTNRSPTPSPTPGDNGLLENATWEDVFDRVSIWLIASQEALSRAAKRDHQRDPSTLPPPRPVEIHRGRRTTHQQESGSVGSGTLTPIPSDVSSSLQPSMAVSDSDSASGTSSTRRRSMSASRRACNAWIPFPARRSESQPRMTGNPSTPSDVDVHSFAQPRMPRTYKPTSTRASSPRSRVVLTYIPTGPISRLPHNARVQGYGGQGRGEASAVTEPPRSDREWTPKFSY